MPKTGIKNQYHGNKFRSLLEQRVAYLLDRLNIEWEYEPAKKQLENGAYIPDFYLTNRDQWIEAKGAIQEERDRKWAKFGAQHDEEIILLQDDKARYGTPSPRHGYSTASSVNLIRCTNCQNYGLVPHLFSYHCRQCGKHNGDHDIIHYNLFGNDDGIQCKGQQHPFQVRDKQQIDKWITHLQNR